MIIPPQDLSEEALDGLLEAFINREGTDYGDAELSMAEKLARLRPQVMSGEVIILYDESSETFNLLPRKGAGGAV